MTRLLVCMGLLLVVPVVAVAQAPLDDNSRRLLNGYYFIPSTDVASPFVTSFVRSATGVGVAVGLTVPIEDLDGNVVDAIGGDLAFLILDFQYQQAITKWLALRAGFVGSARVGTDEQSLLTQGITSVYGFDLGATAQLLQTRSFLLSAVVNYTNNQIYAIAPFDFVKSVIDSGFDPGGDNNLLQSGSVGLTSGGLRMAFAPSDWIGFTALAEAGIGERFIEEAGTRGSAEQSTVNGRQHAGSWVSALQAPEI